MNIVSFYRRLLCVDDGEWRTVILNSSDRQTSIKSLELIQDLNFDAIVPWVAIEGEGAVFLLKMRKINVRDYKIIDCVRRGEHT